MKEKRRMLRVCPDFVLQCAPALTQHRAATFVLALFLFSYITFVGLRASANEQSSVSSR